MAENSAVGLPSYVGPSNRGRATILGETRMPDIFNIEMQRQAQQKREAAAAAAAAEESKKQLRETIKSIDMGNFDPINITSDAYIRQEVDGILTKYTGELAQNGKINQQTIANAEADIKRAELKHNMLKSFQNTGTGLVKMVTDDLKGSNPIYMEGLDERIAQTVVDSVKRGEDGKWQVGDLEAAEKQIRAMMTDPNNINAQSVAKRVSDKYGVTKETSYAKSKQFGGYIEQTTTEKPLVSQYFTVMGSDGKPLSLPVYDQTSPQWSGFKNEVLNSDELMRILVDDRARKDLAQLGITEDNQNFQAAYSAASDKAFSDILSPQATVKETKNLQADVAATDYRRAALARKAGKPEPQFIEDRFRDVVAATQPFGLEGQYDVVNERSREVMDELVAANAKYGGQQIAKYEYKKGNNEIAQDHLVLYNAKGEEIGEPIKLEGYAPFTSIYTMFESSSGDKLGMNFPEFEKYAKGKGFYTGDPETDRANPSLNVPRQEPESLQRQAVADIQNKPESRKALVGQKYGEKSVTSVSDPDENGKVKIVFDQGQSEMEINLKDKMSVGAFMNIIRSSKQGQKSNNPLIPD